MNPDWPQWALDFPEPLQRKFLGTAVWQWLGIVIVVACGVAAYAVGRFVAARLVKIRERLGARPLMPGTAMAFRRATGLLAAILVWYPLLEELALNGRTQRVTDNILAAVSILTAALLAYAVWDAICDDLAARSAGVLRTERLLVPMARKFVRAVIVCVACLIAATYLFGADVRGMLASIGIGGLVVALAAKDSVENVFGSFTILFDMPFALGDWVRIDKTEGVVEEINLRSTRIRTFEDTLITLPNANLIRASVENVSARRGRRQQISVRISYDTKAEAVDAFCAEVRAWLKGHEKVIADKTIVQISDMSESSLGVLVQCQFEVQTQAEELAMRHELADEILRARDRNRVLFAAAPRPLPPTPP